MSIFSNLFKGDSNKKHAAKSLSEMRELYGEVSLKDFHEEDETEDTTLEILKELGKDGLPEAGLSLGQYYLSKGNLLSAFNYFLKARDAGCTYASWNLLVAAKCLPLIDIEGRDKIWYENCLKAALGGVGDAMKELGDMYLRRKDYLASYYWYQMAVYYDKAECNTSIDDVLNAWESAGKPPITDKIDGVRPKEVQNAIRLFRMMTDQTPLSPQLMEDFHRYAMEDDNEIMGLFIGHFYEDLVHDDAKAVIGYQLAAHNNSIMGMKCLADMQAAGKGCNKDMAKAREWYKGAAELGEKTAAFVMGEFYRNENTNLSAYWYAVSYRHGYEPSMDRLMELPYTEPEEEPEEEIPEWEKGICGTPFVRAEMKAKQRVRMGELMLETIRTQDWVKFTQECMDIQKNELSEGGLAVGQAFEKKNKELALDWYEKSAGSGNAEAARRCAEIIGHSDKYDIKGKDENWYGYTLTAAKHGNPDSMTKLGEVFEGKKDYFSALYWYQNALLFGYPNAYDYIERIEGKCLSMINKPFKFDVDEVYGDDENQAFSLFLVMLNFDKYTSKQKEELIEEAKWFKNGYVAMLLGTFYENVDGDEKRAVECYRIASKNYLVAGAKPLANLLMKGEKCQHNKEEAIEEYRYAALGGDSDACMIMGDYLSEEDPNLAAFFYTSAFFRGRVDAKMKLDLLAKR